jgi:hypothetical protein
VGIQRNSGVDLQDNNYWVTYEFFIDAQHTARGVYLLENPATLGDMPRLNSDLSVRYSALDPQMNRPWDEEDFDYNGLFQAELALLAALTLLLCGLRLR